MIFECSKCRGVVNITMLTSDPPKPKYVCSNCGAVKEEKPIKYMPIIIDMEGK